MKLPVMIIYDVAKKVFDKKTFPQGNIAGLISGITFVFFSQEMPVRWKETYTYARTRTRTCTHITHTQVVNLSM